MIKLYGNYPYPHNFTERNAKSFIFTCEKTIKDPEVKIYCQHLIAIINKDYQKVLNFYKSTQKNNIPEMEPNEQIRKFMPAIGYSYQNEEKAAKLAQEGKYIYNIDINEKAKKQTMIKANFLNCLDSLSHFTNGLLSEDDIYKDLEDFYNDFKENYRFFEYPIGYNLKNTQSILSHLTMRNKSVELFCVIFINILLKQFEAASKMLQY